MTSTGGFATFCALDGIGMKTILILYENNGAGHRRAAKIIESMLADRADCRVTAVAGSELFNDPGVELINRFWIYLVRKNWITLADWLLNFYLRAWILPMLEAAQLAGYHDKLDELAPDVIVCTADGFGKVLGLYAQARAIPLYLVITEFTMFADVANPMATHICYFPETINAIRSYRFEDAYFSSRLARKSSAWDKIKYVSSVHRGHIRAGGTRSIYRNIDRQYPERNHARCIAVGPLVEPVYYIRKNKLAARQMLGIDKEKPCVLLISGSIGGDYLDEIVTAFQDRWGEPLTLLAVCGRDQDCFRRLDARKLRSREIEVRPLGFVETMDELYAAADVVIARPSASVLLEAMMRRVPLLIPKRATVNDLGGAELINKHFLGEVYGDLNDLFASFQKIAGHKDAYADAISRFLAPYPAEYADLKDALVEIILGRDTQRLPDFQDAHPAKPQDEEQQDGHGEPLRVPDCQGYAQQSHA